MVEPTLISIFGLVISFFKKIVGWLFHKSELEDYIGQISFIESLNNAIHFGDIPKIDVSAVDVFLHSDVIKELVATIYTTSDDNIGAIEEKFVKIFCQIRPIESSENEAIGHKIFSIVKKDLDDLNSFIIPPYNLEHSAISDYLPPFPTTT